MNARIKFKRTDKTLTSVAETEKLEQGQPFFDLNTHNLYVGTEANGKAIKDLIDSDMVNCYHSKQSDYAVKDVREDNVTSYKKLTYSTTEKKLNLSDADTSTGLNNAIVSYKIPLQFDDRPIQSPAEPVTEGSGVRQIILPADQSGIREIEIMLEWQNNTIITIHRVSLASIKRNLTYLIGDWNIETTGLRAFKGWLDLKLGSNTDLHFYSPTLVRWGTSGGNETFAICKIVSAYAIYE